MRRSARNILIPVLLALVTAAIYLPHLEGAPAFLSNDERFAPDGTPLFWILTRD